MTNDSPMQSPANEQVHSTPLAEKQSDRGQDAHQSLLQSRGAVLSFLFLVAGVLGIPLLWVNPNFSRGERVLWTIIVLLYSLTILILAGGMLWWIYRLIFG